MDVSRVRPGQARQAHDGVAMHAGEPFGLPDPIALDHVLQDREGFVLRQARVEQRCALAFGEACLAGVAVEQPDLLMFAVAVTNREVAGAALAVEGTSRILAAEPREVVHGCESFW